ncbi:MULTISPECIES: type I-E CRISPR-associated protein Cse2/CasB [unclassified Rathayibacter]|uniref:type I-E CRISPR-associated protein Cse2/CasB n=1 Tax=unclassified Rathayibacter TaxID=2609250 RepID=UPI00188AC313|nr:MULTISPECIES: type I-E CRISPR-associated protein Cse2/CasB [unclassified Rathayibacter]MBF4460960.1 type I-E CRISPR-associated protein Cse2/CasB [Rathayibacter sp. VKM Ac-2879]MBF4502371.1 type I-E CRISPR-associated protein Cse2/CasB [Rathayibacter sp. VKM Ac-2878]
MSDTAPTPPPRSPRRGWPSSLAVFVGERVADLQRASLATHGGLGRAAATASLARLRRAATGAPGADPLVWGETLDGLPVEYHGVDGGVTSAERAAHAAITLYAVHQQSKQIPMHRPGVSLGRAVARLAAVNAPPGSEERPGEAAVVRRFLALGTAATFDETVRHARGLITQFRADNIPLDYGLLAYHLARLQVPRYADGVRLDWGRDFYFRTPVGDADATSPNADAPASEPTET